MMIERNKEWILVAQRYEDLTQKIKFLTEEKSKAYKILQELSEHKDSCGGGYEFKTYDRLGTVNYKSIPELKNIDLSIYRADNVNCWKLTFIKQFKEIL